MLFIIKQVCHDARSRECEINRRIMSRIAWKRESDAKSEIFKILRVRSSSSKFLGVIACSLGVLREVILLTWHRSVVCHH